MTLRLCVVGGPQVRTSPSAAVHEAALRACGIDGAYELRPLGADALPGFIAELRDGRYRGCNVTMPFKASLAEACDELLGDARLLGAVNTVSVEAGRLLGSNTDVPGFTAGLEEAGLRPGPDACAVVIGAGGAAAAVALGLLRLPVALVTVVARRADAARNLASRLSGEGDVAVAAWGGNDIAGVVRGAGIVVNATPAGQSEMPFDVRSLPPSCTVADVRYRPRPVDLVVAAAAAGLRALDGSGMLLHQAALSFQTWTGVTAPVDVMRSALDGALA